MPPSSMRRPLQSTEPCMQMVSLAHPHCCAACSSFCWFTLHVRGHMKRADATVSTRLPCSPDTGAAPEAGHGTWDEAAQAIIVGQRIPHHGDRRCNVHARVQAPRIVGRRLHFHRHRGCDCCRAPSSPARPSSACALLTGKALSHLKSLKAIRTSGKGSAKTERWSPVCSTDCEVGVWPASRKVLLLGHL
jgi:hypothetical protein